MPDKCEGVFATNRDCVGNDEIAILHVCPSGANDIGKKIRDPEPCAVIHTHANYKSGIYMRVERLVENVVFEQKRN
jgi:hypothetical protein